MAQEQRLRRGAAIDCRRLWTLGGRAGAELDGSSAGDYDGALRREAARPDSRKRARHGLAAHLGTARTDRCRDRAPRPAGNASGGVGTHVQAGSLNSVATVLLTAFEPYDRWTTNASALALVAVLTDTPP